MGCSNPGQRNFFREIPQVFVQVKRPMDEEARATNNHYVWL
jgi:hypothetical protein